MKIPPGAAPPPAPPLAAAAARLAGKPWRRNGKGQFSREGSRPAPPSPSGGAPRAHYRPIRKILVRGLAVIDKRSLAARAVLDWRRDLIADLGGEASCSAAQLALIEIAARTRLYLDHIDAHLLQCSSLLTKKKPRRLLPLVEQRQRVADSLARLLAQLGLERRVKTLDWAQAFAEQGRAPRAEGLSSTAGPDGAPDNV